MVRWGGAELAGGSVGARLARLASRWAPRLAAITFFVAACVFAVGVALVFPWSSPSIGLDELGLAASCAVEVGPAQRARSLHLYAAQARWAAILLLLLIVSIVAVVYAVATFAAAWREADGRDGRSTRRSLVAIAVVVVVTGVWQFLMSPAPVLSEDGVKLPTHPGLLSHMLATFRPGCEWIIARIWPAKRLAEAVGLVVGGAMTATAVPLADRGRLIDRIRRIQRLLYAGSLLFVAGMLMTQNNFSWITGTWVSVAGSDAAKEVADLVSAGTIQSGVVYSAMLAVFFLPARAYLAWQVARLPPDARQAHDEAAKQAGLAGSVTESAKQILALLAPVLSAPVLDALVKAH
jgi:hypothetical protein